MSQHVADRILTAIESRLALVPALSGRVYAQPLSALDEASLPAAIIDDVEDEVVGEAGFFPVEEQHALRLTVFVCQMASAASFRPALASLHHDVEQALVGSIDARTLSGLLTVGLKRVAATYVVDADALQKPVGGWRISFTCTYFLRSDQPGLVEKE